MSDNPFVDLRFLRRPYVDMVWRGVSSPFRRCASAVGELAKGPAAEVRTGGNESVAPGAFPGDRSLRKVGLASEEIRAYDEAEAASLGRARMTDGSS